jgi:glutamyl-tRNA synthetase
MRPDGRFAPSPTGVLHVGNLRTALLAWLFARSQDARFLMRIEDLDAGRVRRDLEAGQLEDLRAIGIDWDGRAVRQSERQELYAGALERLDDAGLLYRCWCTRAEIREAASAAHGERPEGAYPGTCRELTAAEVAKREASGRPPAWRVRAGGVRVTFTDRLCGETAGEVDDFVVRRNDGAYAYNLAVVVDDAEQGIGEVVRGADLLDSTPRQLWLGGRLGLAAPVYAHVPLMLGSDGARLAKRHGAPSVADLRAAGRSPESVVGSLLAGLGLLPEGEHATPAQLLDGFRLESIAGSPAGSIAGS